MKRRQGLLILVVLALSTLGITALTSLLTYNLNMTSNGAVLTLTDPDDLEILELDVDALYIGESGAVFFRLVNLYSGDLTISLNTTLPDGYEPGDPHYGYKIDNLGSYIPMNLTDTFVVPETSFVAIALNVVNVDAVTGVSVGSLEVSITD